MTNLSQSSSENTGQPRPDFPKGLRVLVIDDNPTDLDTVGQMLRQCQYNVTACPQPNKALDILREKKGEFDVVLCDVYMTDMDGFQLLETIKSEMSIPVIMMSAEDEYDLVLKLFNHGACYHLTKPVSLEEVENIWKHLAKRQSQSNAWKDTDNSMRIEVSGKQKNPLESGENAPIENEGNSTILKREMEPEETAEHEEQLGVESKKPRVVWTPELHNKFVEVVQQLEVERKIIYAIIKAVPRKILELMNEPGLNRQNISSHLQKYREHLRRSVGPQHQGRSDVAFPPVLGEQFNQYNSFQTLAPSDERPAQALMTVPRMPATIAAERFDRSQMNLFGAPMFPTYGNIHHQVGATMFPPYGNIRRQVGAGARGFASLTSSLRTSSSFPAGNDITNPFIRQVNPRGQLSPLESSIPRLFRDHGLRYNSGYIPRPVHPNNQKNIPNQSIFFTEPSAGRPVEELDDITDLKGKMVAIPDHDEEEEDQAPQDPEKVAGQAELTEKDAGQMEPELSSTSPQGSVERELPMKNIDLNL